MQEVAVKTHLIITDIHDEYVVKWFGKIIDSNPMIRNEKPIFVIVNNNRRIELNTIDMKQIEDCAKQLADPRGRQSFTTDTSRIYIKEVNGNEKYIGKVIKNHIKKFAPMYDKVGFR